MDIETHQLAEAIQGRVTFSDDIDLDMEPAGLAEIAADVARVLSEAGTVNVGTRDWILPGQVSSMGRTVGIQLRSGKVAVLTVKFAPPMRIGERVVVR